MIDKNTHIVMMYDCYQSLLTDKQRQMMDLYYNQDFTLAEIAEELGVSRQAVYDHIRRTIHLLEQYEEKMGLLEIFRRQSRLIRRMKEKIAEMETGAGSRPEMEGTLEQLRTMKELLEQLYQTSTS